MKLDRKAINDYQWEQFIESGINITGVEICNEPSLVVSYIDDNDIIVDNIHGETVCLRVPIPTIQGGGANTCEQYCTNTLHNQQRDEVALPNNQSYRSGTCEWSYNCYSIGLDQD